MPTRSNYPTLILACILALISGCSNIISNTYVHDKSLKEKTDRAHGSFSAVEEQPDFFRSATELLEQAGQERMDARRRRLDALHELTVATLISDDVGNGSRAIWQSAKMSFENELRALSALAVTKTGEWQNLRDNIQAERAAISSSTPRALSYGRSYRKFGGKKSVTCSSNMEKLPRSEPGASAYNRLVYACKTQLDAERALSDLTAKTGISATEYHVRREELKDELDTARNARALLRDRLGAARQAFNDETTTLEQNAISAISGQGEKLSAMLASIDGLKLPGTDTSLLGVELAGAGGIIDWQALAKSIRAEILTEELEDLVNIMSDPDIAIETDAQRKANKKFMLIVQSDTALRGIRAFRDMNFPTPQSALMLLEHYRSQSAAFDRQIRHLSRQYELSAVSASAAEKKIQHLMDGLLHIRQLDQSDNCKATGFATYIKKCDDQSTLVAHILISFDQAHIQGTLPAALAFDASLNNDMLFDIEASRGHAEHVLSILKPAIATLKAYGDGGIKSETIAQLIATLSLMSIAVGVNQ